VIVGGGGFRVPLVYRALADGPFAGLVSDVVLLDASEERARAIARVLQAMPLATGTPGPTVRVETDLARALPGADIVFAAVRSGGATGRVLDERVALEAGLLGQETVGAGGISYALRSIPDMLRLATAMRQLAPEAWLINFTNPAGMVTEAVSAVLDHRVIGICDSASGLVTRAARAVGLDLGDSLAGVDYVGLNHLGWLRRLDAGASAGQAHEQAHGQTHGHDGGSSSPAAWDGDRLPALLADPLRLGSFEEGRLFGPDLLGTLGALPNEYLFYYYFHREALRAIRGADRTRGEILRDQQQGLYPRLAEALDPFGAWEDARRERESGYLAEARTADEQRDEADLAGGGYERVALRVMRALLTDRPAELILNVRNGTTFPELPKTAVVEVPAVVKASGAAGRGSLDRAPARAHGRRQGRGAGHRPGRRAPRSRSGPPRLRRAPAGRLVPRRDGGSRGLREGVPRTRGVLGRLIGGGAAQVLAEARHAEREQGRVRGRGDPVETRRREERGPLRRAGVRACGDPGVAAGPDDPRQRRVVVGRRQQLVHLQAQRQGQVERPHEQHVDAVDRGDVPGRVESRGSLDQHGAERYRMGAGVAARGMDGPAAVERTPAPGPERRIVAGGRRCQGVGDTVHEGDDDAVGARIQGTPDQGGIVRADPDEHRGGARRAVEERFAEGAVVEVPVLRVERDPSGARAGQFTGQAGFAERRPDTEQRIMDGRIGSHAPIVAPHRPGFRA
jgi:6-phospho-beta-glucosidase